jgi:protocatechuate 3,4-dioxygenase beta subunit
MKSYLAFSLMVLMTTSCHSQSVESTPKVLVGGPCEGCEAVYDFGDRYLPAIDTLPGFEANEPKLMVSGTVFEKDGKSPAKDVTLYVYHTNRAGIYESKGDETGWGRRHGYIRAWLKTDENGHYTFYTFRPAAYPGGTECEHIHITVKEPDKNEYYIDELVFADDPLLTLEKRKGLENRGGSGVCTLRWEDGIYKTERDITLGLNIPDYPE